MKFKEAWNKIAELWNKYRNRPLKEVVEFLKKKKGRILDLACGTGRHFSLIKGEIYGVDFSEKMLEIAERNAKKQNFECFLIKTECNKLPFKSNFFDSAIFIAGLHCIKSKKKRKESLEELYRVLKNKAQVLISVWSRNHKKIQGKTGDMFIPWEVEGKKIKRYYYIYKKKELENELRKTRFKILKSWENDNLWFIVEKY